MRLVSFVRNGRIDCGVLAEGGYTVFDGHVVLGALPPERRLPAVLAMSPDERRRLAGELDGAEVISPESVALTAAVPLCPLYIYNHANNPTVWRRQTDRFWETTRLPYMRIRPFTSLAGDGAEISVPAGGRLSVGAEFGVVVGKPAYRVTREAAADHIAGIVCQCDSSTGGMHEEFVDPTSAEARAHQRHGLDTLAKSADGNGLIGPWITTCEELDDLLAGRVAGEALTRYRERHLAPWLYDKMMRTRIGGQLVDESCTNAYIFGSEWMLWYFSQFMTLPTGSVIGLGAAGWDGVRGVLSDAPAATLDVELELQDVGVLHGRFRRAEPGGERVSPFLNSRRRLGLPAVPNADDRPGPSLWVLRGNYPQAAETEGIPPGGGMNPLLYPATALRDDDAPIVLPPHATAVRCSAQLAGVIGPECVYHADPDRAASAFSHIALLIAVRDTSLADPIRNAMAYELRAATFLGGCGDGFFRLGSLAPAARRRGRQSMILTVPGCGQTEYDTGDYLHGLSEMLCMVSRLTTLLPGDVLALGPAGPETVIQANTPATRIEAAASWDAEMKLAFDDRRDGRARDTALR